MFRGKAPEDGGSWMKRLALVIALVATVVHGQAKPWPSDRRQAWWHVDHRRSAGDDIYQADGIRRAGFHQMKSVA
jgi:hypothetical protein